MEKLIVENFLSIEKAELEIGRFTVIIGPQASGKSVLAKLVYFFRDLCFNQFRIHAADLRDTKSLAEVATEKFVELFSPLGVQKKKFVLQYFVGNINVLLARNPDEEPDELSRIDFSDNFAASYDQALRSYQQDEEEWLGDSPELLVIRKLLDLQVKVGGAFIPASRSFFAYLQRSVFSSLEGGVLLDTLFRQFGAAYERARQRHAKGREPQQEDDKKALAAVLAEAELIWAGRYRHIDGRDWIESNDQLVSLQQASSGQQEALPMLLVLSSRLRLGGREDFIVEEPEAHLFPASEKRMVTILSLLYEAGNDFLLTTHSPYILTAINDSILAAEVLATHPEQADKIREILGNARPIAFGDVRAYTITDGRLESILDEDNQLIGTNIIDAVSDDFQAIFNGLLAIKYPADGNA
jgi:hypothetical protein